MVDDGTHTVSQYTRLEYQGQVVYEKYNGKRPNGDVVTCGGPFPYNGDFATITVISTIQH